MDRVLGTHPGKELSISKYDSQAALNSKGVPKIWQFGLSIREGQPTDLISFVVSKNHSFRGSLTPRMKQHDQTKANTPPTNRFSTNAP